MKNSMKTLLLIYLSFFSLFFLSSNTIAANSEIYINPILGISMTGPDNWFLEMKDRPSAEGAFLFKKAGLYAVFTKYDIKYLLSKPTGKSSIIQLYIYPLNNLSAMDIMKLIYKELKSGEEVVELPREVKINNQSWVEMVTKTNSNGISFYQVTYITKSPYATIQIEALTGGEDFNEQRKLFEKSISTIIFSNNERELQTKFLTNVSLPR